MPRTVQPTRFAGAQAQAAERNAQRAGQSQQEQAIGPGGSSPVVVLGGVIPTTPSGTPGPATGERFGQCFYDQNGTLRVQIDAYGWHKYTNQGVYSSELVTY